MPEILSVLFALLILVALFKLFFDDLEDLWTSVKSCCCWFGFSIVSERWAIFEWRSPKTEQTGSRLFFWLAIGALGGFMLYHNLSK
ncbi:MAG TPA: hypothetical protein VGB68_00205 [Pyrinomonadaceae bacterium]|jgi:hypothetical protein